MGKTKRKNQKPKTPKKTTDSKKKKETYVDKVFRVFKEKDYPQEGLSVKEMFQSGYFSKEHTLYSKIHSLRVTKKINKIKKDGMSSRYILERPKGEKAVLKGKNTETVKAPLVFEPRLLKPIQNLEVKKDDLKNWMEEYGYSASETLFRHCFYCKKVSSSLKFCRHKIGCERRFHESCIENYKSDEGNCCQAHFCHQCKEYIPENPSYQCEICSISYCSLCKIKKCKH